MASENSAGIKEIMTIFLLGALFFVCIMNFGIGIAERYGHDESLVNDERMNLTGVQAQLESNSEKTNEWINQLTSDSIFESGGALILFSIWGIVQAVNTAIIGLYTVIIGSLVNVLGLDPLVVGTISGLVLIGIVFAIWRLIKQGE